MTGAVQIIDEISKLAHGKIRREYRSPISRVTMSIPNALELLKNLSLFRTHLERARRLDCLVVAWWTVMDFVA